MGGNYTSSADLNGGLLQHLPMDSIDVSITEDVSVNSINGNLFNITNIVEGKIGNGLEFNGTNSYININNVRNYINSNQDISININFKLNDVSGSISLLGVNDSGGDDRLLLFIYDGYVRLITNGTDYDAVSVVTSINTDEWYNLSFNYYVDGTTEIYVNGIDQELNANTILSFSDTDT